MLHVALIRRAHDSSMRPLLTASVLALVTSLGFRARADEQIFPETPSVDAERVQPLSAPAASVEVESAPGAPREEHPTPKLKLSYVRFSAAAPMGGAVPLEALRLDMYSLSWRWFRGGVDAEAGRGQASVLGAATSLKYGLLGLSAGVQLPGRITPFFEGRLAGGVLAGTAEGAITVPGTTIGVTGASAATWIYASELDAGAEIYVLGRAYLSTSLGLIRTTWHSADAEAGGGVAFKDVTRNSLLLKVGLGI
jgi:hypothetical protein